ncbi:MAG: hypothetical protein AB7O24_21075, partial [Kofleriaceae bacterium]
MSAAFRTAASLALLVGAAQAQPKPPTPTDPADVAYREGRRLYDLREFPQAIERFKEAYRLREDPASLFNIAQSYRLLGDCPNAHAYCVIQSIAITENGPSRSPKTVDGDHRKRFIAIGGPAIRPPSPE